MPNQQVLLRASANPISQSSLAEPDPHLLVRVWLRETTLNLACRHIILLLEPVLPDEFSKCSCKEIILFIDLTKKFI